MKRCWKKIQLGEVLELEIDAVPVDPTETYSFAGVYGFGRGLFFRGEVKGTDTTYAHFHRLHTGQLVMSQPKGWEGAITVVPHEFEGRFLSSVFPTFRPITGKLSPEFLRVLTKCPWLWDALIEKSVGIGARRNSIYPAQLLEIEVPLPSVAEQERIVVHLDAIETRLARVQKLREKIYREIEAFNTSLHLTLANNRNIRLDQLIRPEEEQVSVVANQSYPQAGIRSFGLGLFKKAAVSGSETSYRTFNILRPGMLVMSQVKGWEGAVSVVGDVFDGWFVSPEYRTFSCNDNECDANYLAHIVGTTWFRNQLSAATRGVGARRERVRPEVLLGLEMPFPKYSDQIKAVGLLEKILLSKKLSLHAVEKETSIIPSLLDKIFRQ